MANNNAVKWACVVTTAPRTEPTIHQCTDSLCMAGWEPVLFAEPNSSPTLHCTRWNQVRLGVWHNWLAACRWAVNQDAELILTAQDDILMHPDAKRFTEGIEWPKHAGFVSLYTPKHYTVRSWDGSLRPTGVNAIPTRSLWGACALVWKKDVLQTVIEHPIARQWLGANPRKSSRSKVFATRKADPSRIQNSDTAIGKILNKMGLKMYFVDPSPSHHFAKHSAIGHGDNSGRRNAYRIADFDKPLGPQVFGGGYYAQRAELPYYDVVCQWLGDIHGESILDVGCADSPVATWGNFRQRFSIDNTTRNELPEVTAIVAEWPGTASVVPPCDVVTCLQVIEHTSNPREFVDALFGRARQAVIISVPWGWNDEHHCQHVQSRIGKDAVMEWTRGRKPSRAIVVGTPPRAVFQYDV